MIYASRAWSDSAKCPWKELIAAFYRTAIDTAVVMILIGGSNLLSWVLARSQLPQLIVSSMHGFSQGTTLLLINLLLLLFGMFLEPAASVLLASSILLPLVKSLNIDLIHFGIIMIVNLQIGVLLPPIGASPRLLHLGWRASHSKRRFAPLSTLYRTRLSDLDVRDLRSSALAVGS